MLKISDLRAKKVLTGDVGIELEVEGLEPLPTEPPSGWKAKKEDSLRHHGMEYISDGPIPMNKVRIKFTQLLTKLHAYKLNHGCSRTSLHAHYNVGSKTPIQVLNRITVYWMVENILARMCGEAREGNVFCLRLKDAEAALDSLVQSLDYHPPFMCLSYNVKYAGLNLWAIPAYGSLEVRLKGDCLNIDEGVEWITELHTMFENADKFENPEAIMDYYLENGADSFLYKVFSTYFENKIKATVPMWRDLIQENALLVCDLAYAKSWPQWVENYETKMANKKIRKSSNPYAMLDDMPVYANAAPTPIYWTTVSNSTNTSEDYP